MSRATAFLLAALLAVGAAACSDDSSSGGSDTGSQIDCRDDQLYDQVNDICVNRPTASDAGDATDTSAEDTGGQTDTGTADTATADTGTADTAADTSPDVDTGPPEGCDEDGDGELAESCGGFDCDDNDRRRAAGNFEICDTIDNDCSGTVNDNISCTFYAHSGTQLFAVDPFLGTTEQQQMSDLPDLLDIDTHPDGTLFGIAFDGLHRYDAWGDNWIHVGAFGHSISDPNGLAIDLDGDAYISSEDKIYSVNLRTGQAALLGSLGSNFYSSGDIVVNKGNTLFVTSKHDQTTDHLVSVDRVTGRGTEIGPIGYRNVFALTSAWGVLYGLTGNGELIKINQRDGAGELVDTFGVTWYGAASTPDR